MYLLRCYLCTPLLDVCATLAERGCLLTVLCARSLRIRHAHYCRTIGETLQGVDVPLQISLTRQILPETLGVSYDGEFIATGVEEHGGLSPDAPSLENMRVLLQPTSLTVAGVLLTVVIEVVL